MCRETIYQALYNGEKGGLSRKRTRKLRTGRPLRKRRRRAHERTPRFVASAQPIAHRPTVVEERSRVRDWKKDLIPGRGSLSAIGHLACRRSRYIKLVHLARPRTEERAVDWVTWAVR